MAEIVIENLHKTFGDFVAVQNSTFTIDDGDFFMLLGPSGCGKTTTLRMIAGLEQPSSGRIMIAGEDVTGKSASERDIAFVFQMFALYPHMNVRKNISYPLASQGVSRKEIKKRVNEVARILQITDILDRPVSGLSGGDRQRVALGRAIVRQPKAFMMDEPLGALDSEFRELMARELRDLHDRMGATTVYVTHDQLEAMQMGNKIVVMNNGIVEQFGTPREIYDNPASAFVADFIGSPSMNLLPVQAQLNAGDRQLDLGHVTVALPTVKRQPAGDQLLLGVRPEHIRLDNESPLKGRVFETEYLGTTQIVTLKTDYGRVKARVPADLKIALDDQTGLHLEPEYLSLFDAQSGLALEMERTPHG